MKNKWNLKTKQLTLESIEEIARLGFIIADACDERALPYCPVCKNKQSHKDDCEVLRLLNLFEKEL